MKQMVMTEREMLEDGLSSQKNMAANYNTYSGECSAAQLRSAFLSILSEEQELGAQIFEAMSARGWYQVKEAEQSDIMKAKQKFIESSN